MTVRKNSGKPMAAGSSAISCSSDVASRKKNCSSDKPVYVNIPTSTVTRKTSPQNDNLSHMKVSTNYSTSDGSSDILAYNDYLPYNLIARIADQYMIDKKDQWETFRMPILEMSAQDIYLEERHTRHALRLDLVLFEKNLSISLHQLYHLQFTNYMDVQKMCDQYLSEQLTRLFAIEWKIDLLSQPSAPTPRDSLLDTAFGNMEYPSY
ncbi:hypothetical protein BDF19DRAFT_441324 [Syncephalis fuscata]|nr:hypothetical protein BDF19DRAFT_441324 [Syncephalis fuscata]